MNSDTLFDDAITRLGKAVVNRILRDAIEDRDRLIAAPRGLVDDLGEQARLRAARVPAPQVAE